MSHWTRRSLLHTTPALGVTALLGPRPAFSAQDERAGAVHDGFPSQDRAAVRETVLVSHGNLDRVRELVTGRPELARAAVDWGFGDWETALGAAAHTGSREIALLLLEHGARPTLFSAAMLGQLEVVRAFVEASPGVQRIEGPHGIPLLDHARAGGEPAAAVVAYLEELGDAGRRLEDDRPLDEAERARYLGTYAFGPAPEDRFTILERRERLRFQRGDGFARNLYRVEENAFHPEGASTVRVRFRFEEGGGAVATVSDGVSTVAATRVAE